MKVAVYMGPREPFRIEERAIPEPGEDELLIRVGRCGICATDVSTWTGDAGMEPGLVYGHEFAGEVVDRGEAVHDIEIGTRITAQCVTACGECDECRRGHLVFCPEWRPHPSGGFGQFMTLPAREAYVLPPSLTLEDGALVEPLAVGLRGVRLAGLDTRSRVLVLGAGPIGLSAAFWARRLGAPDVVVAATSKRRRDFALEMGATDFVVLGEDSEASIRAALGGPPDIVLECAGFPGAMMQAMSWIRPKGTIVCMGYGLHPEEITTAVPLLKELRVQFSMTYDHRDYEEVISTLASGHLEPRCMITRTIGLEDLTNAIEGLLERAPQCKVMVDPWA
jgi:(R,R)-butanediol dehydrogenase/meso-butanediol dehydrogenase/diacetyl reductase